MEGNGNIKEKTASNLKGLGHRKRIGSLGTRLVVIITLVLCVVFTLKCIKDGISQYSYVSSINIEAATAEAQVNVEKIQAVLSNANQLFLDVEKSVQAELSIPIAKRDRNRIVNTIRNILVTNSTISSICVYFEPNAFDGKDDEFKTTPPYTISNGRFTPYAWQNPSNSEIRIGCTAKLNDTSKLPEWYTKPFNANGYMIFEPYKNTADNITEIITTLACPIIYDGKRFGVINIDIELSSLQGILEAHTDKNKESFFILCTETGSILAHGLDAGKIMQNELELHPAFTTNFKTVASTSQISQVKETSSTSGAKSLYSFFPVRIAGIQNSWVMLSVFDAVSYKSCKRNDHTNYY